MNKVSKILYFLWYFLMAIFLSVPALCYCYSLFYIYNYQIEFAKEFQLLFVIGIFLLISGIGIIFFLGKITYDFYSQPFIKVIKEAIKTNSFFLLSGLLGFLFLSIWNYISFQVGTICSQKIGGIIQLLSFLFFIRELVEINSRNLNPKSISISPKSQEKKMKKKSDFETNSIFLTRKKSFYWLVSLLQSAFSLLSWLFFLWLIFTIGRTTIPLKFQNLIGIFFELIILLIAIFTHRFFDKSFEKILVRNKIIYWKSTYR